MWQNSKNQEMDAPKMLRTMIFGYMPSRVVHTAARLGIADELADGTRTLDELASATSSDPASLERLLAALAALGVVVEIEPGTFQLGPLGGPLRADAPNTMRGLAMHIGGEALWQSWGGLLESVRSGDEVFEKNFQTDYFTYLDQNPEPAENFNTAMGQLTEGITEALVSKVDFSRFRTLVDVGGGNGTLISAILGSAPDLRGVLFDTPSGVEQATKTLAEAGVTDRCEVREGDFFDSVPSEGDAYVLKSVIHDWDDEPSEAILRTCAKAMSDGDRIILVEPSPPVSAAPGEQLNTAMSDLNMMVLTGGRERTVENFRKLFDRVGLEVVSVTPVPGVTTYNIIEGTLQP